MAFDNLSGLALGIVTFAITIGIGVVVLTKFGGSLATCAEGFTYNSSIDLCGNDTGEDTASPTGTWTETNYLSGQLGTSGLSSWTPAIIALVVGMLFLRMFMAKKSRRI